ncbi:MAG: DNA recombination protein RmuC [Alphaproteobacteria bacterium]
MSDLQFYFLLAALGLVALLLLRRRPARIDAAQIHELTLASERTDRVIRDETARMRNEAEERGKHLRGELREQITAYNAELKREVTARIDQFNQALGHQNGAFEKTITERLGGMTESLGRLAQTSAEAQEKLRANVEQRLEMIRSGNEAKLEQMRATVEEKLQGTLEKRLGESFALVSERLEHVQRGLGEMQSLAVGVGDLKKVLANVKDRGGWAEIQLGALLEHLLAPEQYRRNARIDGATQEAVEYAICMPGPDEGTEVLLPIDAKFPKEDYERLLAAWEAGDRAAHEAAIGALESVIDLEAKRIASKYIKPPRSTDFAVMYLPTEGLFAEAMRIPGLAQKLQAKHRVTLAGPTTLSALLNSLQMGFRTLAIQKRSSEVWRVLGEAKAEFEKYNKVWETISRQLATVQNTVQDAGVRTRAVARRLKTVGGLETELNSTSAPALPLTLEEDVEPEPAAPANANVTLLR